MTGWQALSVWIVCSIFSTGFSFGLEETHPYPYTSYRYSFDTEKMVDATVSLRAKGFGEGVTQTLC